MKAHEVKFWLDRFEIGEPIKSLFQPKWEIGPGRHAEHIEVVLHGKAPDACGSGKVVDVHLAEHMPLYHEPKDVSKYCADFFRMMLHKFLLHEADESILFGGVRKYDPHG